MCLCVQRLPVGGGKSRVVAGGSRLVWSRLDQLNTCVFQLCLSPVYLHVCTCLCFGHVCVQVGRFIRHRARARKEGVIVNCTAISVFRGVHLCLDCSPPPAFLICRSFALLLFSINLPQPLPHSLYTVALPCSSRLSFSLQ